MRSEQSWSLLDPRPVLLYLPNVDEYIVYWNGIATTHSMALCAAMEQSAGIWPTPEMKSAMEQNYQKIYYAGGFETRAWDLKVSSSPIYPYVKRLLADHLKTVLENKTPAEVLTWFNYNKARPVESKHVKNI